MIRLPGLIDAHVHLRTPGQTHKEDFYTGTGAALAGGFTTILDMPNNLSPIVSFDRLQEKIKLTTQQAVCDIGFYFGSLGNNLDEFKKVKNQVFGLKLFLNKTTGNFIIDEKIFKKITTYWPKELPILLHAEEDILESVLNIANNFQQKIHVCHISSEKELRIVMRAKEKGQAVTCGVTPHHLFLSNETVQTLGPFGKVKPYLKSKKDVAFLWSQIHTIDIIESDHAPHTIKEKQAENPPFGMPGLESTLPLLLTAVHENKLTIQDIKRLCHDNPAKIFHIKINSQTFIVIDENEEWMIKNTELKTKCGWSPFNGRQVYGKIKQVILRGKKVYENNIILSKAGSGSVIIPHIPLTKKQ